ncbi:MAG: hypothetical protein ACE5GC_02040 [Acidimicrobiia bacterium]
MKGGTHSSVTFRLHNLMDPTVAGVVDVLADTVAGVRSGEVSPAVANTVASSTRAMIAASESKRVEVRLREKETV